MPAMFKLRRCYAVFVARNREFYRDRGGLLWALFFPFLLVFVFSFALSNEGSRLPTMGVLSESFGEIAFDENQIRVVIVRSEAEAQSKLREFSIDIFYKPASGEYWMNPESPEANHAEKILWATLSDKPKDLVQHQVEGKTIRYIRWLFPGLLGMNIMFSTLFGVGFVIVRYRRNGVLRRFKATPISSLEFVLAQVFSRLVVLIFVTFIVYFGIHLVFKIGTVTGSVLALLLIFLFGSLAMIAIGLLMGTRTKNEELSSGLLNLVAMPMMLLSGVWFSIDNMHPWAKGFTQVFPLTHMLQATRSIMLHGARLVDVLPQIAILGGFCIVFFTLTAILFRWE